MFQQKIIMYFSQIIKFLGNTAEAIWEVQSSTAVRCMKILCRKTSFNSAAYFAVPRLLFITKCCWLGGEHGAKKNCARLLLHAMNLVKTANTCVRFVQHDK